MRKLTVLAGFLATCLFASAQKNKSKDPELPAFGKIEKADLELKECSFDEKAEAMVLIDDGQLDFIFGKGFELKHRVRIKILSEKGLEEANIHLSYISAKKEEDITGLEAVTYNLDAAG